MTNLDYLLLGSRIKENRLRVNVTQEKLAEDVGVSVAHISHIETGNTIPSMKTFVTILNSLGISADEVLLGHLSKARHTIDGEMAEVMAGCKDNEALIITDVARACRDSLRKYGKMVS